MPRLFRGTFSRFGGPAVSRFRISADSSVRISALSSFRVSPGVLTRASRPRPRFRPAGRISLPAWPTSSDKLRLLDMVDLLCQGTVRLRAAAGRVIGQDRAAGGG